MTLLDRLLRHDVWTTRQFLLICLDLPDDQLDREFDIGHRSIRATLSHLIANMEVWGDLMDGREVDVTSDSRRGKTSINELLRRLEPAGRLLQQVACEVARRDGWDEHWVDPLDGTRKTYGGAIAHVITHSMHHRAQLLYLLRKVGVADLPEGDVLSWEAQSGDSPSPPEA